MFRQNGVHFVAVANNIDSEEQDSGEFAPFLNIMNEWYLRDQSKRFQQRTVSKGKAGKPTTNNAIYGYKKDPEDKDHWLVDEEAAAVVRDFPACGGGHGPYEISKILTQEKVELAIIWPQRQRPEEHRGHQPAPMTGYGFTVSSMLTAGVHGAYTSNSVLQSPTGIRGKNARRLADFENNHEAIVDPETWQLAQQVKRTVRRTDTTGVANPFTGLVFCADCGAKMYNHRGKRKKDGREYNRGFLQLLHLHPDL